HRWTTASCTAGASWIPTGTTGRCSGWIRLTFRRPDSRCPEESRNVDERSPGKLSLRSDPLRLRDRLEPRDQPLQLLGVREVAVLEGRHTLGCLPAPGRARRPRAVPLRSWADRPPLLPALRGEDLRHRIAPGAGRPVSRGERRLPRRPRPRRPRGASGEVRGWSPRPVGGGARSDPVSLTEAPMIPGGPGGQDSHLTSGGPWLADGFLLS